MAVERTFSMIKPDATKRNLTGKINARLEEAGLRIVAQKRVWMSRRQAEGIRWRWSLTGVEGVSEESIPPVWGVGMAGLLQHFQEAQGTGFHMINWGCKVS